MGTTATDNHGLTNNTDHGTVRRDKHSTSNKTPLGPPSRYVQSPKEASTYNRLVERIKLVIAIHTKGKPSSAKYTRDLISKINRSRLSRAKRDQAQIEARSWLAIHGYTFADKTTLAPSCFTTIANETSFEVEVNKRIKNLHRDYEREAVGLIRHIQRRKPVKPLEPPTLTAQAKHKRPIRSG
jgi:hypothetical protein